MTFYKKSQLMISKSTYELQHTQSCKNTKITFTELFFIKLKIAILVLMFSSWFIWRISLSDFPCQIRWVGIFLVSWRVFIFYLWTTLVFYFPKKNKISFIICNVGFLYLSYIFLIRIYALTKRFVTPSMYVRIHLLHYFVLFFWYAHKENMKFYYFSFCLYSNRHAFPQDEA